MKSKLFAFSLMMAAIPSFAQEHLHDYNKSAFSNIHKIRPYHRNEAATVVKKVQQLFPGMNVSFDQLNQSFNDIFGKAFIVQGATIEQKAQRLINNELSLLGINAGEWQMVANVTAPHATFINYEQWINGHKVVFADLKFRFTPDGRLERIKMKNYGVPVAGITPSISAANAQQVAENELSGITITESNIDNSWYWFPVPSAKGYELRPAYSFNIKGQAENLPVDLVGYVDAISGNVLYRTNNVKETVNKTVDGSVYKQNPLQPASNEPLANLKVTISGTDYFTDTAGILNIAALNAPVTATVKLEGRWARVVAVGSGNVTPNFQNVISTNGLIYTFPTTSPSSDRHVNAYYHVNKVHDFMKGFFPTFTVMDNPLTTNVDVNGSCNAFYNGSSINFYTAGNGCNSFALCGDIIYHEYGHGISDKFYNTLSQNFDNGALGEANSDIWGISITNDPVLGRGSTPTGGMIRRYDQAPKVYPQDIIGEVHADGEIIAGAWWDLALNLNSTDTMTMLFAKTYWDTPNGPNGTEGAVYHDVLISALVNDDNDNNLNNGTPHFNQIVTAFARHGIYLLGDAQLTHNEVANQPANTPTSINAGLTVSVPAYLGDLKLYYRPRGGQWDSLTMVPSGGNSYTAQIPGQAAGTIIDYYFGLFDNANLLNITFPGNYAPTSPLSIVTIPYQYGIGLDMKAAIDFESPLTGWTIGNVLGDNATNSGIWIQAKPIGSFESPAQLKGPVQPNGDHTTDTTQCLVTGNASSIYSGTGQADVDGGRTSVITQVFDLTGYAEPIIEYWRWYSNNSGSNPGEDYWNVYIKDSASSFWLVKVDNTRKTDNSWRRRIFHTNQYTPGSTKIMLKFVAEDANGGSVVEAAVDDIFVYDKANISNVDDVNQMKARIYPNPASNEINVQFSEPLDGYIALYDLSGKQITKINTDNTLSYTINTEKLAAGAYFLTIKSDKMTQSHKIVIAH